MSKNARIYQFEVTMLINDDKFIENVHSADADGAEWEALDLHWSGCYPWQKDRDDRSWYDGCEILSVKLVC